MDNPKISVIVPVYKVEPYLRKCLDSIVNQTYRNLEIILVDDGSPDNCGAICDEYAAKDGRIQVIHQENGGVSATRNAGLDAATGDWIGFVDSDDWIEPDMYQYLLENVQSYKADVATCGIQSLMPSGMIESTVSSGGPMLIDATTALQLLTQNRYISFSCCDKLAKSNLWKQMRFPNMRIWEDFWVSCCLFENSERVICLPEVKYHYFARPESGMTTENLADRVSNWEIIVDHCSAVIARWPQLEPFLAGRCALMAVGIWGSYYSAATAERKGMQEELQRISAFCRAHISDARRFAQSGHAGRLVLRLTAYPTWWAFFLARGISWIYRIRHKRPLT